MNIVITGANRGIGLELAAQLAKRGASVIAVCRKASKELESLAREGSVRIEAGIDVADAANVAELAKRLAGVQVDVLINNAGILSVESLGDLDFGRIQRQFEVNTLGPLRVTHALLGNLKQGSKVAIITSRMGSIGDNGSGSYYGYRMSKAAVNAAGKSLANDLAGRGIAVAILHPGAVRTEMTRGGGNIDVDESARGLIARLDALTLENTGTFWHQDGQVLPW